MKSIQIGTMLCLLLAVLTSVSGAPNNGKMPAKKAIGRRLEDGSENVEARLPASSEGVPAAAGLPATHVSDPDDDEDDDDDDDSPRRNKKRKTVRNDMLATNPGHTFDVVTAIPHLDVTPLSDETMDNSPHHSFDHWLAEFMKHTGTVSSEAMRALMRMLMFAPSETVLERMTDAVVDQEKDRRSQAMTQAVENYMNRQLGHFNNTWGDRRELLSPEGAQRVRNVLEEELRARTDYFMSGRSSQWENKVRMDWMIMVGGALAATAVSVASALAQEDLDSTDAHDSSHKRDRSKVTKGATDGVDSSSKGGDTNKDKDDADYEAESSDDEE